MKKYLNSILSMAALLMASAAVFTACSSDDNIIGEQPANPTGKYTMTINASKGGDATTRALSLGRNDADTKNVLNATWDANEVVLVYQGGSQIGTLHSAASTTNETTLTGELDSAPDAGQDLTLYFHTNATPSYAGQDGTLATIASTYDFCAPATITAGSFTVSGSTVSTTSSASFGANQQAIVKFSLTDKTTTSAISATQLVVNDGTTDYTITPASATSEIYVALPGFSGQTVTLTATAGGNTYFYEKTGVSFTDGQYYEIGVKMSPIISLSGRFPGDDELVIADGCILTDFAVGQSCKVSIADGATVTLRDVENNGKIVDHGTILECRPGIKCLGDATIILEGNNTVTGGDQYAGIYVPGDKTLTIRGTGSLNVTGGSSAAGIGGNATGDANCGSIVISGGTVTATGGDGGAGIGLGANGGECKDITISGGTVTAKGGSGGAGIGLGARWGSCKAITISGGTVTATGSDGAPGIGGVEGVYESITITGDVTKVTVNKGSYSTYSIGIEDDYSWEDCGPITIGGTVYFDEGSFTNNDLMTSPFVYQP